MQGERETERQRDSSLLWPHQAAARSSSDSRLEADADAPHHGTCRCPNVSSGGPGSGGRPPIDAHNGPPDSAILRSAICEP